MMEQLPMFYPTRGSTWLRRFELPMRGLSSYQVLARSCDDPKRRTRKEAREEGGTTVSWKGIRDVSAEKWAAHFCEILGDGQSRTFNALVLEATCLQVTADTAAFESPHIGLALALRDGRLMISNDSPHLIKLA